MSKYFFKVTLIFFIFPQVFAYAEARTYQLDASKSELNFTVDSTLHEIHGHAADYSSEVTFDPSQNQVTLPMSIEIVTNSLDTDNKKRDKAMLKMLEVEGYPVMRWKAQSVACEPLDESKMTMCQAAGKLKIRDIEKEISFPVRIEFFDSGAQAEGVWSFERRDFGLETPSVLGLIRVAQPIEVKFKTKWILK